MIKLIPDSIGWTICAAVNLALIIMVAKFVKLFLEMWEIYNEEEEDLLKR